MTETQALVLAGLCGAVERLMRSADNNKDQLTQDYIRSMNDCVVSVREARRHLRVYNQVQQLRNREITIDKSQASVRRTAGRNAVESAKGSPKHGYR